MKLQRKVYFALSFLIILTVACNLSSPAPAEPPTQEVITIVVTATEEAAAPTEDTSSSGGATATLNQDLNVRSGPGTAYPIVTALTGGTTVEIIGKNSDGSWWLVALDNGNSGWVSAPFTTSSNTEGVPVVNAAAPPQQSSSGGSSSGSSGSSSGGTSGSSSGGGGSSGGETGGGSSGGGQAAPSDSDIQITVNAKNGSANQSGVVSYPDGDTTDKIFVTINGFDSIKTSGNVTYTLTCTGGTPKVKVVGGAVKNGSPGCNKTWTVFYTNDSNKETITITQDTNGYSNWILIASAGG